MSWYFEKVLFRWTWYKYADDYNKTDKIYIDILECEQVDFGIMVRFDFKMIPGNYNTF